MRPDVEALARQIAREFVHEWMTGDSWYGYPSNEDEEQEAMDEYMPHARKKAEQYLQIAGVLG